MAIKIAKQNQQDLKNEHEVIKNLNQACTELNIIMQKKEEAETSYNKIKEIIASNKPPEEIANLFSNFTVVKESDVDTTSQQVNSILSNISLPFKPISDDSVLNENIESSKQLLWCNIHSFCEAKEQGEKNEACKELIKDSATYIAQLDQYYNSNFGLCSWVDVSLIGSGINWMFSCNGLINHNNEITIS